MTRARRALRRGYTAVEVMISIAVLAVGAAGVLSMQKGAVQGNYDARQMDMANAIAREWMERLRRDAATWTLPSTSQPNANPNWSTRTTLLSTYGNSTNRGKWNFPAAYPGGSYREGYSAAFDMLGRDVTPASGGSMYPNAVYCAQVKLDWLVADQLVRASVRVYWLRRMFTAPDADFCNADTSTNGPSASNANEIYHFVYVTSSIAKNPAQ